MVTVTIKNAGEVKRRLEEMRARLKFGVTVWCGNCRQTYERGTKHECPEIIDAVFVEDRPQLPETTNET
jgi:hypothetical protein